MLTAAVSARFEATLEKVVCENMDVEPFWAAMATFW